MRPSFAESSFHCIFSVIRPPSLIPSKSILNTMHTLNGKGPSWLKNGKILSKWHGFRAKPINRGAPVLEKLEPGLIVATGHYRNGVLLAPATALWVGNQILND